MFPRNSGKDGVSVVFDARAFEMGRLIERTPTGKDDYQEGHGRAPIEKPSPHATTRVQCSREAATGRALALFFDGAPLSASCVLGNL
jgi:hypothetical protein